MALVSEGEHAPSKNCHRLVIIGSSKVGKTSIVSRFLNNKFDENYTPTIEDFHRKIYRIKGEAHRLDILDTSGNHPFPAMRRLSLLTGDIFIMVYSIDNHESFEEVKRLYDQIIETKDNAVATKAVVGRPSTTKPIRDTIPIIVVGNKCDKERQRVVRSEDVRRFVDSHAGVAYVESSAKLNINIEEIFLKLFLMAKLPTEMSPSLHRRVQPNYVSGSGSASTARPRMTIRRRLSDACGTVAPNARRPSIRTDLMILQANQGSIDRLDGPSSRRDSTGSVTSKCEIQ